jgi:hypothetical protein
MPRFTDFDAQAGKLREASTLNQVPLALAPRYNRGPQVGLRPWLGGKEVQW